MPQRTGSVSICRPCRRAGRRQRSRQRSHHRCYGAVQGEDRADATTWVACGCDCQRTLESLGFVEGDTLPPTDVARVPQGEDARATEPDAPASR
jgi:hypothetical protein